MSGILSNLLRFTGQTLRSAISPQKFSGLPIFGSPNQFAPPAITSIWSSVPMRTIVRNNFPKAREYKRIKAHGWRTKLKTKNGRRATEGMWNPTHVHVIVHRAENLLIKGKNGTNNSFVVIELGKESYRTSIKEKSGPSVTWNEDCELKIPKAGNTAVLEFTAFHRNTLGLDQFLGKVKLPLFSFDKYHKSTQWYNLQGKPGKAKGKDKLRGQLEVQIGFLSKLQSQSLTSLQSKGKLSIEKLTGSLFTLGRGDKNAPVKKFVNSLGKPFKKKKKDLESTEDLDENDDGTIFTSKPTKNCYNLDPGVISDDEDSASNKNPESLANSTGNVQNPGSLAATPPPKPKRSFAKNPEISISQWEDSEAQLISSLNVSQDSVSSTGRRRHKSKLEDLRGRLSDRRLSISCVDFSHLASPKPEKKFSSSLQLEKNQGEPYKGLSRLARKLKNFHSVDKKELKRTMIGAEYGVLAKEEALVPKSDFKNKNKDELIGMVVDLQKRVNCISVRVKDLEDYLDDILLKVMETVPKILEKS